MLNTQRPFAIIAPIAYSLRYRFKPCIISGPAIIDESVSVIFGVICVGEQSGNARSARNRKGRKISHAIVLPFAALAVHCYLCATALNLASTADQPLKTNQLQQFLDLLMLESKAVTQGAPGTARGASD